MAATGAVAAAILGATTGTAHAQFSPERTQQDPNVQGAPPTGDPSDSGTDFHVQSGPPSGDPGGSGTDTVVWAGQAFW